MIKNIMRIKNHNLKNAIPGIFLFLAIVVFGVMYLLYTRKRYEKEQADVVMQIARSIAASLSKEDLMALEAIPADIDKPQYRSIKNTLKAIIHVNNTARFAYLFTEHNGKIYFLADSEPEYSKDYSPPGQEYTEAKPEDKQPFRDGKEIITNPLSDRWGRWITAYIPIKDENTGKTIAVFGMDFNEKSWNNIILFELIESSALIALLLLSSFFLIKNQAKNKLLKNDISKRKQIEGALQESERSKAVLLSNLSGLAYRCRFDRDWSMEFVSEGCFNLTGYKNEAFIHNRDLSFNDIIKPEFREHLWEVWENAVKNHLVVCEEYKIVTADNQEKWVWEQGIPIYNEAGEVEALEGLIVDITERKRAEEALHNSEEKYRTIFENVQDVFYQTNLEGTILEISPSVNYFSEFQRDKLIGTSVYNLYNDPKDRDILIKEISKHGELRDYELRLKTKTGQIKHVSINASLIIGADGKPNQIDGAIRDITERKQADEALSKSEERQRFILESLPIAIYTSPFDPEIDTSWISGNVRKITGFEIEEYLSANDFWHNRLHREDKKRVLQAFSNIPDHGETILEYRWKCKDGQYRWFQDRSVLLENESRREYLGVIADITEIKHAQEEINVLNAELEQRVKQRTLQLENTNKELEAFSYSVSHDLRSPLRGIDGWSMALLEDYNQILDEQGRGYLNRVRHESQRMGDLIDDLLKLSLVNRSQMKKVDVEISTVVRAVASRMIESHAGQKYEIIIQPDVHASGDPKMLEIAITNLLDNACKFTGSNTLTTIEFGQLLLDGIPTFYLRDNGVGFDMEYAGKLFGAFQRMHKRSDFPGSGIGLATVQRIISRHGGRVWAESKQGEGSTFYFTLP